MLLNFSVSNFASIDDELILNLTAHKRARKTGLILNGKYKTGILPLTALYGANGSGKSNIITALGLMKDKVLGDTERIRSPDELDVKRYGVVVSRGYRRGLLLPNLEGVDTVEEQIAIARQKAGIPEDADDIVLERFEVVRHQ